MQVVPTCLREAESLRSTKVKGDNPFSIYNGFLYAPLAEDDNIEKISYYEIDFGLTKKVINCSNFIFTTPSGNKYYFSFPQRATVHLWMGQIMEMNRVEIDR